MNHEPTRLAHTTFTGYHPSIALPNTSTAYDDQSLMEKKSTRHCTWMDYGVHSGWEAPRNTFEANDGLTHMIITNCFFLLLN